MWKRSVLVEEIIIFFSLIAYAFFLYAPFILLFPSDFFSQQNHKITLAPTSTIEFEKSIEEKKKSKKEKRIKSRRKKEKQKKSLEMVQRKRKMVGMRKRKKNMGGAMWGFVCWM